VAAPAIRTPDQRLRVFISSTIEELAAEREAAREAIERLRLTPVLFELGARSLPPADVYRAYLDDSDVFVGIYGERYGWVGPGMEMSGLEDEFRRSTSKPRLIYVKKPVAARDVRLTALIEEIENDAAISYKTFESAASLRELLQDDLAVLLTERFVGGRDDVRFRPTLPAPVDRFVGRAEELGRIDELLGDDTRLITIAGPGGVGKSRLALEAARRSEARFRDGAAFVPLDAVVETELVAPTVLAALALRADAAADPADALGEQLRDRELLLVLDNFEQIVDAAPNVGALLARCPGLAVLATSRSPLRIRGEHELRIEPLGVPSPAAEPAAVADADAVRLFADRARQLEPTFELTSENTDAVAELCRKLEGLPLALELAAARIRLLPPQAILERVEAGLDVLAEGARDTPTRQRSLRATIEWSFDLLDDPERAALVEASVFRGGWDLAAAENVLGADAAERLDALLEHSLVKRLPREQARFGMLESIRSLAAERLDDSGRSRTVQRRHAAFYLDLVARVTPALYGSGQGTALHTIERENDNLRAAIEWCLADDEPNAVAEVAPGLMHFWWLRGNLDEGLRMMALVLAASALAPANRARALLVRGFLGFWRAPDTGDARDFAEAAAIFDAEGDRANAALARIPVATLRAARGDRAALDDLDAGRTVLLESGDAWGSLLATNGLCWALNVLEEDAALSLYEDGVARATAAGVEAELATALGNLARRYLLRHEPEEAQRRLMEALQIARRLRSRTGTAYYVSAFADLAARRGELELAVTLFAAVGTSVPVFARDRERTLAQARDLHGEGAVAELERAGAELGLEAAAEEALAWANG
jgi:predicted ATPase